VAGSFFTLAFLVALGALAWRRISRRRKDHAWLDEAGHNEASPKRVASYEALEHELRWAKCQCGGYLRKKGERTTTGPSGTLSVVTCECESCEERRTLYFQLDEIPS
jgi:hypothetical protein